MKLIKHLWLAVLTWLATNLFASLCYLVAKTIGIQFDPFLCSECDNTLIFILTFGLIFSAPFTCLLPFIYLLLERIQYRAYKIFASLTLVFAICVIVIGTFIQLFGTDGFGYATVATFLLPYVLSAEISFMLIGKKLVFDGQSLTAPLHEGDN